MKRYVCLILCIGLNLACREEKKMEISPKLDTSERPAELREVAAEPIEVLTQDQQPEKSSEWYYVSAKSGLNYRKSPNGKLLGKFHLNKILNVLYHTETFEEITDEKKKLQGEWLGVAKGKDTVYVHSGFLSSSYTFSDLEIYFASPVYNYNNEFKNGFINLTENKNSIYGEEYYPPEIPEDKIGQDSIQLSKKYRQRFFRSRNIGESDKLFIYNIPLDSIFTLSLIAPINGYSTGKTELTVDDYEIGFDLGQKYRSDGTNFAYIGNKNIFQSGYKQPLIWEKADDNNIPFDKAPYEEGLINEIYTYRQGDLDYFIRTLSNGDGHRFVVVDRLSKEIIFEKYYANTEGTYLTPLHIKNKSAEYQYQWTGKIFKNKPPIVFGLLGDSYGCPRIDFLSRSEPSIMTLCDNRH